MSKIFKISGNFKHWETKEWIAPEKAFEGEIVVDEGKGGIFEGYCNELYESCVEGAETRYLTGYLANNGKDGKRGICFFRFVNTERWDTEQFMMANLEDENCGAWAMLAPPIPIFVGSPRPMIRLGIAKVSITEIVAEDPKTEIDRIKAKYNELDRSVDWNGRLEDQVDDCLRILESVE